MSGRDKAFLTFIALIILAVFLFAGEPDITDAIIYSLMSK
jgi:hypothetical protein